MQRTIECREGHWPLSIHDALCFEERFMTQVVGQSAGEEFVEHDPESVDIAPHINGSRLTRQLLGTHVLQGADMVSNLGLDGCQRTLRVGRLCNAEINHLRMPLGVHENVAGLQVAVNHASLVAMSDGIAHASEKFDAGSGREGRVGGVDRDRLRIRDVFHDEVGHGRPSDPVHARGEYLCDTRVPE
jgi:hypothetical protein